MKITKAPPSYPLDPTASKGSIGIPIDPPSPPSQSRTITPSQSRTITPSQSRGLPEAWLREFPSARGLSEIIHSGV
jgi:hypothetical protein